MGRINLYPFTEEHKIFILRSMLSMNLSPTSIAPISSAFALHMCIASQDIIIRLDVYSFNLLKCIFLMQSPFHFDDTDSFLPPNKTKKWTV
jgi:hypothetical protein